MIQVESIEEISYEIGDYEVIEKVEVKVEYSLYVPDVGPKQLEDIQLADVAPVSPWVHWSENHKQGVMLMFDEDRMEQIIKDNSGGY